MDEILFEGSELQTEIKNITCDEYPFSRRKKGVKAFLKQSRKALKENPTSKFWADAIIFLEAKLKKLKSNPEIKIDMWYGDRFKQKKYGADAYFRDQKSWFRPKHCYAGNIYDDKGKTVGDYTAANSTVIEEYFNIKWKD